MAAKKVDATWELVRSAMAKSREFGVQYERSRISLWLIVVAEAARKRGASEETVVMLSMLSKDVQDGRHVGVEKLYEVNEVVDTAAERLGEEK